MPNSNNYSPSSFIPRRQPSYGFRGHPGRPRIYYNVIDGTLVSLSPTYHPIFPMSLNSTNYSPSSFIPRRQPSYGFRVHPGRPRIYYYVIDGTLVLNSSDTEIMTNRGAAPRSYRMIDGTLVLNSSDIEPGQSSRGGPASTTTIMGNHGAAPRRYRRIQDMLVYDSPSIERREGCREGAASVAEIMRNLQVISYDGTGDSYGQKECSICFEDLFFCEGVIGKECGRMPCGHIFHHHCIEEWLRLHSRLCPLCRRSITLDDRVY